MDYFSVLTRPLGKTFQAGGFPISLHQVTRSISTPPGWDASPLQGSSRVKRGTTKLEHLALDHNAVPWPRLAPGLLQPDSSAPIRPAPFGIVKRSKTKLYFI